MSACPTCARPSSPRPHGSMSRPWLRCVRPEGLRPRAGVLRRFAGAERASGSPKSPPPSSSTSAVTPDDRLSLRAKPARDPRYRQPRALLPPVPPSRRA
eukprot:6240751-Prymnesium_polylepis.1